MLEAVGQWLAGITCAALVAAMADRLTPPGPVRRIGRLTCGLVLLTVLLAPLLPLRGDVLSRALAEQRLELEDYRAALEAEDRAAMKTIIEERCAAYIQDKAAALGIECAAAVEAEDGEGWPVPRRVTVTGPLTAGQRERLAALIQSELAVPEEEQIYLDREEP